MENSNSKLRLSHHKGGTSIHHNRLKNKRMKQRRVEGRRKSRSASPSSHDDFCHRFSLEARVTQGESTNPSFFNKILFIMNLNGS